MTKDILICTLNSSYQHSSFGLRYLIANLGELQARTEILEFTIAQNSRDIVEKILARHPKIVGFGVYIWNTIETKKVVEIIKSVAPEIVIILGGPEVTHESETQSLVQIANHTIKGEADFLFENLCQAILSNSNHFPKIIAPVLPDIKKIKLPYSYYSENDIKNRIIYVEASRGCPYKCEYCLSSLDKSVRNFELDEFLSSMENLLQKGARQFKFVDRTFNLSPTISCQILKFFLERIHLGLFLHFEMVPDRLPDELKILIEQFPAGSLQFEIGVQTFNPAVAQNVSRRQDYNKIKENLIYLKTKTHVHTHVDLIAGLPGENFTSFSKGFDLLAQLEPDEIQLGILKRLKGFPLARHDDTFKMQYDKSPPFQILQNADVSFNELQDISRFSKVWDMIANSGNFNRVMHLWKQHTHENELSLFDAIHDFSKFLAKRRSDNFGISLLSLLEVLYLYFQENPISRDPGTAHQALALDYAFNRRRDLPYFLKQHLSNDLLETIKNSNLQSKTEITTTHTPNRQKNHLQH